MAVRDWRETSYWNHNSAYHSWIVRVASKHRGRALDVGCGEGLLVQRLASVSAWVVGIDPDPAAIARARERAGTLPNVTLEAVSLSDYEAPEARFDLLTFVASLHHMDMATAIHMARALLNPGGELLVVGLSANKTVADWTLSGIRLPLVRLGGWLHHETRNVGVVATDVHESLRDIRDLVGRELPEAHLRRGLYYRYLLRWKKPHDMYGR